MCGQVDCQVMLLLERSWLRVGFVQDNLSRGNLGAVKVLQGLFPKPGRLQFLYVDLGDSKAVSSFCNLHLSLSNFPVFQFSSPTSRVSLSYQNVLLLDRDCTGKWGVHQKCNRCSYAFCCSGLCRRKHGRAPSVSLKSSCTAGVWWTIFLEVYFQQLFLIFCIVSCEWSLWILPYLVVYKSWLERHLYLK